jgi:hypothetical protein
MWRQKATQLCYFTWLIVTQRLIISICYKRDSHVGTSLASLLITGTCRCSKHSLVLSF